MVCDDIRKLRRYKSRNPNRTPAKIALLLVTHVDGDAKEHMKAIIKYSDRRKNLKEKTLENLKIQIDEHFRPGYFRPCASGDIVGGKTYDMTVTIHYRLFGPY